MFYIGLYREKHEKILLSKTTRHRALIFGVMHYLVVLYPVCSNYTSGPKKVPPRGHMLYIGLNREKHEKNLLA